MNKLRLIAIMSVLTIGILSGQNDVKRSIILVNGVAHIADLTTNGSIVAQYQAIPNYFDNQLSDEQIIANAETQGLENGGSLELYADNLDTDVPDITSFRRIDADKANSKQYIAFSRDRALLNRQAVDQIRTISDAYTAGQITQVTINSYHKDDIKSRTLAENRSKAIMDLLSTFGVDKSAIQVNLPYGTEDENLYFVYLGID